jgi:hypothetical protein
MFALRLIPEKFVVVPTGRNYVITAFPANQRNPDGRALQGRELDLEPEHDPLGSS